MSRRPTDKAGQNQQVIKNLLRLEANKMCADCKKNKHPRWASWNLGIFVCIRCSGIHRGMGTHISRVKSVDLDAWTDEQLQSIMKWGNARANRYWEHKLAPGHVPSDAKIENFIRTKYESRRWVMDGPIPDPSTLGGDGDEDVPLSTVQDKARLDRSASQRAASGPSRPIQPVVREAPVTAAPSFDLMGPDPVSVPQRASTAQPTAAARPPPPQNPPQQSGNLLGGLNDFLSGPPSRPTSTGSGPAGMSRPDLKQSILSLYASKPAAPAAAPQASQQHQRQASAAGAQGGGSFGGLNDAFGGLSFGSASSAPAAKPAQFSPPAAQKPAFAPAPRAQAANPNAYAALTGVLSSPQSQPSITSPPVTSPPPSGGGFFDAGSKPPTRAAAPTVKSNPAPPLTTQTATDDWGDFSMADNMSTPKPAAPSQPPANKNAGLLDFTAGGASNFGPPAASKPAPAPAPALDSVFNLSSKPPQPPQTNSSSNGLSNFPSDPWGNNEWATPDPAPAPAPAAVPAPKQQISSPKPISAPSNDFGWSAPSDWGSSTPATITAKNPAFDTGGWGDPTPAASTSNGGLGGFGATAAPKVQPEEDFGGWGTSEPTPAPPAPQRQESASKPSGGISTSEDLFGNVWG